MTHKFELGRDFCTMHLHQVSSCYVYSFGRYRVDKHTNKQKPLKTFNVFHYAATLGNDMNNACKLGLLTSGPNDWEVNCKACDRNVSETKTGAEKAENRGRDREPSDKWSLGVAENC